jgi:hypothetical protein
MIIIIILIIIIIKLQLKTNKEVKSTQITLKNDKNNKEVLNRITYY